MLFILFKVVIRDFMGKTAPKAAPTVRIVKCVTLIQGNVMNLGVLFLNIRHQIVLVSSLHTNGTDDMMF